MIKRNIDEFTKGWVVGDFDPVIIKNKDLEVAVKYYKKDDIESMHVHKQAIEITVVVNGEIMMNDYIFKKGEICILEKNEPCKFKSLQDNTITMVIKSPSIVNDKYILE